MCYFFTYESILRACVKEDQKISDLPLAYSLLGGAFAGIAFWILAYPFDYVKTLMQTDNLKKNESRFNGMMHCFKDQMKSGKISTFYKGIGVALYRAAAVNAGGFFAFEGALRYLGKPEESE
jgi:solute carrier family 25 (mitochondrial carnitine/acylcarnitine transporter), member 20/29